MQTKTENALSDKPGEIALDALRLLAGRREAPTPDAYRRAYEEVTALQARGPAALAAALAAATVVAGAAKVQGQARAGAGGAPVDTFAPAATPFPPSLPVATAATDFVTTSLTTSVPTSSTTSSAISSTAPGIGPGAAPPARAPAGADTQSALLRELLARTLGLAVVPLLQGSPELTVQAETLAADIRQADDDSLDDAAARLRQLCFKIEMRSGDMLEQQELLLRLFRLLLDNVSQLLDDDTWMQGQIASINALLAGPLSYRGLEEAARSLKEVVYKQGVLKQGMSEAKSTVKKMMLTFIDQLVSIAASTGDFQEKIDRYSQQVSQATDIDTLNMVLEKIMQEAHATQLQAMRSRDNMIEARRDVDLAETRIQGLQAKLVEMSELVREDHLTGVLNRRGLDDMLEQEIERSQRRGSPLCVALLDLDDFKKLNDTHGHMAGDQVLVHLVQVIRDTLRSLDIIGRFGGEEFVIVLPNTGLDEACSTVSRLQRELTERIFMHKEARLFITFSSGVVLRAPGETSNSIVDRADKALYRAKKAGKNRIVSDRSV